MLSINYRMKNQSLLVILLLVIVATLCHTLPTDNDNGIDEKDNEIERDNVDRIKPNPKIPKAQDPRFNKMLPLPKLAELEIGNKPEKVQKIPKSSTTAVKDETSTIGNSFKSI